MSDTVLRHENSTRNFVATETTDFGGSNRLLRVIGQVEVARGVRASLIETVKEGKDSRRLVLDLVLDDTRCAASDLQWTSVKVFERPLRQRRELLIVDIRVDGDVVFSLDIQEVIL